MTKIKSLLASVAVAVLMVLVAMAASAPAKAAPSYAAISGRATIVWSPHPDDETLRLTAYTQIAQKHGDLMVLVAVTDGGASDVCRQIFTYRVECEEARALEQQNAWHANTWFTTPSTIVRLKLPDGGVSSADVKANAERIIRQYLDAGYSVENYVAASVKDAHPDHVATARGVYAGALGTVVRNAKGPDATSGGWQYQPEDLAAAVDADEAYAGIGWKSTPALFAALRTNCPNNGYCSHIVMYGG